MDALLEITGLFLTTGKQCVNYIQSTNCANDKPVRFLLLRYRCHVNVEVSAHFRCFKYVYKYTFKAPDSTVMAVNEIDAHLSGRLLSVSEAVHRLLGMSLHKEWPPVTRLDIHLPHDQNMVFDPTAEEEQLFLQSQNATSTLLGYFNLNSLDPHARSLLYHEIPEQYVWVEAKWRRRIYAKVNSSEMMIMQVCSLTCAAGSSRWTHLRGLTSQHRAVCLAQIT